MSILYIVISTFLIATGADTIGSTTPQPGVSNLVQGNAKSTTAADLDYNNDYYDANEIASDGQDNTVPDAKPNEIASLPPEFVTKPQIITAKVGDRAIFDCEVKNEDNSVPMWKTSKEQLSLGTTLHNNNNLYSLTDNNSLIINRVNPKSRGLYSCVILISKNLNITLTHRLILENDAQIVSLYAAHNKTELNSGDTTTLTCKVKGKPTPTIKWYFDQRDSTATTHLSDEQTQPDSSTVTIKDANLKQSGTYRCIADNEESIDHQSITIDVFDKGRQMTATSQSNSQLESRTSDNTGSLHLVSSITLFLTCIVLMNQ